MFNLTPQERNAALFLVITLAIGTGVLFFKNNFSREVKPQLVKGQSQVEVELITVHLDGAVFKPGLYRVKKDSRLEDVLKKTELKSQADISNINLARKISDGEKIIIPSRGESLFLDSGVIEFYGDELSKGDLINVNRAGISELSGLPGIGETLAQRIIEYRVQFGPFRDKEELKKVKGIGEKRLEKIKNLIIIN